MRKDKLKNTNWEIVVSFKTEIISEYLIQKNYYRFEKDFGIPLKKRAIFDNDICHDAEEIKKANLYTKKNLAKVSKKVFSTIKSEAEKFIIQSKKISKIDLKNIKEDDLAEVFSNWIKAYEKVVGLIGVPGRVDDVLEESAKEFLAMYKIKNINDALSILSSSNKISSTLKEKMDLIKIILFKKSGNDKLFFQKIKNHAKKYGWITTTLLLGDVYSEKNIKEKIKGIEKNEAEKEFKKIKKSLVVMKKNQVKIIKENNFDNNFLKLLKIFQYATWFRTVRLDWINEGCFLARPMLDEISRRLNMSYRELIYCFPEEIINFLTGKIKIDKKEIGRRIEKYGMYTLDGKKITLLLGNDVDIYKSKLIKNDHTNEICGQVACRGIARGKVCIIKDRDEIIKVERGDILVAKLTTPDFVPAMEKSVAIITDLGGITSHAAIVSRELGIPCIIGTKIATQVLYDGDFIEVDANNGVVRIINKNKLK